MRCLLALLGVSLVVFFPLAATALPGEVLVVLERPGILAPEADGLAIDTPGLAATLAAHGLDRGEYVVRKTGALNDRDRCYLLLRSARAGFDAADAARDLASVPGIRAAAVNGRRELFLVPNDPQFGQQWHLQPGNAAGVHLPEAWDLELGDAGVVIAIMDTGLDWSHPDLAANVWLNPDEIAGNGVDDDQNGYVDDVRGWDFGNHDADARPHSVLQQGLDVGFHGTHCAGIAAAVTNNAVGIAGTAGGCRLMPLKIVNTASEFTDAAVTEAFLYAIDNGADVVSMSFGGPGDGGAAAFFQALVDDAVAAGIVCVAAAGNNNDAALMYPAACAGVISVGATNAAGQRASFSTYGAWVTVNAPGEQIWSTIQSNYTFDFLTGLLYQLLYGWDGVNPYMSCDGTSMACPLVAGVCGLVRSAAPGLSPAQVRQHLLDTGDVVGFDQPLGVKVNALAAIAGLQSTPVRDLPALAAGLTCAPNPFNPGTTMRFAVPAAGPVRVDVYDARGAHVRTLVAADLGVGDHAARWDGRDDGGKSVAAGAYVVRLVAGAVRRQASVVLVK
jgi:subtilisin family serine protease